MASLDHIEAAPNNPYRILRTWSPKSVLMLHVFVESPSACKKLASRARSLENIMLAYCLQSLSRRGVQWKVLPDAGEGRPVARALTGNLVRVPTHWTLAKDLGCFFGSRLGLNILSYASVQMPEIALLLRHPLSVLTEQ